MSIFPQLLLNSIIAGSIYALVALGFSLIYNATRFFNLSHGIMTAVGAYAAFFLGVQLGWPVWLAIILAVLATGIVGWLLDKLVFLQMRKKKSSTMTMLVASLGAFTAIQALIAILFTSQFQTLSNFFPNQKIYQIFGGVITEVQLVIFLAAILIFIGLELLLKYTLLGRAVGALSDDEEVAKIVGINTDKIIGFIFFLGSAIAGLGGIFVGIDTGMEPTMGLMLLLSGIISVIVGGIRSLKGALLGSFLVAAAENFGIWKLAGQWRPAIAFSVLIIFLLFRPQGIFKD